MRGNKEMRETVHVAGHPPTHHAPLVVMVHEGDPDRIELAPRPAHHSPREVQHARLRLIEVLGAGAGRV